MTIKLSEILIFTTSLTCKMLHKIDKQLLQCKKLLNIMSFNNKKVVIIKNLK